MKWRASLLRPLLSALAVAFHSLPASALTSVRFDPTHIATNVQGMLSINLVADFTHPVLGFGLDISFDPDVLTLVGEPIIGPAWTGAFARDGDGLAAFAPPTGVVGIGVVLAALTFQPVGIGVSVVAADFTPTDLTEGFPLRTGGFDAAAFSSANIQVVPEPATLFLVQLGLTCCFLRRKSGSVA